tara:strand:- start:47 stop:268 length:222 start_codon:yes stop_codon:yes gene_type:complete
MIVCLCHDADNLVATGYGAYIAIPLLRNAQRPDITLAEASKVLVSENTSPSHFTRALQYGDGLVEVFSNSLLR